MHAKNEDHHRKTAQEQARSMMRGLNHYRIFRYEVGKASDVAEIPMDPICAVNEQLTEKAT